MLRFLTNGTNDGNSNSRDIKNKDSKILKGTQLPEVVKHFRKTHAYNDINLVFSSKKNTRVKIISNNLLRASYPILEAHDLETFIEIYQHFQNKIRIIWIDNLCLELLSLKKELADEILEGSEAKIILINTFLSSESRIKKKDYIYQILNNEFYNGSEYLKTT